MKLHLTGLPPLRKGYPASPDLLARRARLPMAWTPEMLAPSTIAQDEVIGGVRCLVCEPLVPISSFNGRSSLSASPLEEESLPPQGGRRRENEQKPILYFHGGGYRLGSPAGWSYLASRLAAATGKRVVVPDYRLAPEHPFPAALHDAMAVYRALTDRDGTGLIVAGDSAGGGLAAALALACKVDGLTAPPAAVLFSPWLDLTCRENPAATDQLFPRDVALEAAALYLQGHDAAAPLASPLHGDLSAFPPVLMFASANEYVLNDVLAFRRRLAEAGAPAETFIASDRPHAWPVTAPGSAETERALQATARFLAVRA